MASSVESLATGCALNFCPGCGDISIWAAFRQAAVANDWNLDNSALVAGVGCHGHMVNFVKLTAFGSLHGRALPVAAGIKMVRNDLNVFVFTGDGDSLAEGGNHFMHAARRNHDITVIFHDNAIYGLTTGQTSPRSPHGYVSKSTPQGNLDEPVNPCALALTAGASFVARVYAGDIPKVAEMFARANAHKGFALVDVLQPCVTFNKLYTHEFYRENTYWLDESYDSSDYLGAYAKSLEWDLKKIPLGVLYEADKPSYEGQIEWLKDRPLIHSGKTQKREISEIMSKYI